MEAQTAKIKVTDGFLILYDSHTKLFKNSLEGLSDQDANNRMNTKANHIAWIAGSLVHQRYSMIKGLGGSIDYTENELFKDWKGIQDGAVYPSLAEYKQDWEKLTPVLRDTLVNLTDEQLADPDPFEMPGGEYTLFDSITFFVDRESYCIGQIGLYRRLLGHEAMKYD